MEVLQTLSLVFALFSVGLIILWSIQNETKSLYTVPILVWLIHLIVFYSARLLVLNGYMPTPEGIFFTTWSSYVRFHAVISIFSSLVIMTNLAGIVDKKLNAMLEKIKKWKDL